MSGTAHNHAIAIRDATPGDVDRLVAIEEAAFLTDRISRRNFLRQLRSPTLTTLVGTLDDDVHGYALLALRRSAHHARLYSLAVDVAKGRGLGRRLMTACEDLAHGRGYGAMRLEVNERNTRAIDVYERTGYRRIGQREDYYEDGATALLYEKALTPE